MQIDIPICADSYEDIDHIMTSIKDLLPYLEENDIYLNLDMDLPAYKQKEVIDYIDSSRVNIVYNVGLQMYLGGDHKEFLDLMFDRIRSVIIYNKGTSGPDRKLENCGDRFDYIISELKRRGYKYDIRIQNTLLTREGVDIYVDFMKRLI